MKKKDYGTELRQEHERWNQLFSHGGQDPAWPDGVNLNLVRNHIIACRKLLEQEGGEMPEEYGWPVPPELPKDYMARTKEIWYHGIESYKKYIEDENYQYLKAAGEKLPDRWKKLCNLEQVLEYVKSVRRALEEGDYVTLRRHEHPERYLESFADCRERIEADAVSGTRGNREDTGTENRERSRKNRTDQSISSGTGAFQINTLVCG